MFCWTSESSSSICIDRGPQGYIARIGVMCRAHDPSGPHDHRDGFPRLRDHITVWIDSDRPVTGDAR